MPWPKPTIESDAKPKPIILKIWFIVLIALLIISTLIILLLKPKGFTTENIIAFIAILVAEVVIWALALSWRMYSYGLELDRYESWEKEKQSIDSRWNDWASRGINILGSHTILPAGISAKILLAPSTDQVINAEQVVALKMLENDEVGNRQQQILSELLFLQYVELRKLPAEQKIKIEIFNTNETFSSIREDFHTAWQQLELPNKIELDIKRSFFTSVIEDWIDNPDGKIKLLLIIQLEDIYSNNAFFTSEFAASLLLASEKLTQSLKLAPTCKVLRPMVSDTNAYFDDLKQMNDIQLEMASANHVWLTGFQDKEEARVLKSLSELKLDLRHDKEVSGVHYIDLYHGIPGKLHCWLPLALAAEAIRHTEETQLTAAKAGNEILFNLIQPMQDKDERDET